MVEETVYGNLRNLPVLSKVDGSKFSKDECINLLGAKCQIIFRDKLTINARIFEDMCQMKVSNLPLPYRLHRSVSTGGMNDPDQTDPVYCHNIYYHVSSDHRHMDG